ncbi:MAG: hypothetical protein ABJB78_03990 [Betaproteobacteria bacterium]
MDRCLTCQFFDRHGARGGDGKAVQWGQCRRNAPSLSPLNAKPHMIEGVWPHVRGDDWCGEYKGLAKRLDAQLTDLMSAPMMANIATDAPSAARLLPLGTPRDGGHGSNGN